MKKVLVTCEMPDSFLDGLEELKYHVDYRPGMTTEEVEQVIHSYYGLIVSTPVKVHPGLIDEATHLEFVGRAGSGMDNIDVPYCESNGIACLSSPEGNRNAVAEHALGMLLALLNNVVRSHNEVLQGSWNREPNRGRELAGRTVGIIGYGNTGSTFVKKLRGLDVLVLVYDKYKSGFGNHWIEETTLEKVLGESDILSLHIPLTDETYHMVDDTFLARCQDGLVLLNTSRGKVVETAALTRALESGKISAAGLDVLEEEPPNLISLQPNDPLTALVKNPAVIFTPHIAGWSVESRERIGEVLLQKIARLTKKS